MKGNWEKVGQTHMLGDEVCVKQDGKRWQWRVLFSKDISRSRLEQVFLAGGAPSLATAKKRAEAAYERGFRAWFTLRDRKAKR